ncbi:hypothetical protein Amet_1835 [Alkaliphilus metalliredigens QYMF]|uniref:SelT/SelW/SelH family protein n=1 Tax=Alkaliphilus metalliredigens (strain QYMF) TaxID=293826 RepID=A6TP87_ALKMQ|nr:hypothetical protein Amet_1835 [Alkaliphilus metalliredigens QYMF]
MAAYLKENLQLNDENFNLVDVGGGTFQVLVNDLVFFDSRTGNGKFPQNEAILEEINNS